MSIRSAIKISLLVEIISKLISFSSVLIIARLLSPEEIGVFAIVSSVTYIAVDLRFFGTGNFIVKEKDVTIEKQRSVLGVGLIISYALGTSLIFSSPALASFFGYADMDILFNLIAISFFIAPFYINPHSMMIKTFAFKQLGIINCISQTLSALVTITLIQLDFSYFSLAAAMNVTVVSQILLAYIMVPNHVIFVPSLKNISRILSFGSFNSMAAIFNRLSYLSPDLIIGKLGVARDVAMFSRSLGFMDFLSQVLTMGFRPVALPYLSESIHSNNNINKAYLRATNLLGSICWPIIAVAAVSGYPIIIFLFGSQWSESIPLVAFLGIWMIFKMIHILAPALFLAANKPKLLFLQSVSVFFITAFGILLSYNFGLAFVAKSMAIAGILEFAFVTYQLKKHFDLSILSLIRSLTPNAVLTLACLFSTIALDIAIDFSTTLPVLSIMFIACINIPLWFVLCKLLKLEIFVEIQRALTELPLFKAKHS